MYRTLSFFFLATVTAQAADIPYSNYPKTDVVHLQDRFLMQTTNYHSPSGQSTRLLLVSDFLSGLGIAGNGYEINITSNDVVSSPWGLVDTTGTKTGGIQEAVDFSFQATSSGLGTGPGGMPIRLGPGVHKTYTNIHTPLLRSAEHFTLTGPGQFAGGITYMGTSNMDVLTIGFPGGFDETAFDIRDLWIASNYNGTNRLLRINGYETNNDYATFGAVGHGNIADCEFMYWGAYGGVSGGTINFGVLLTDGNKHNLIPIDIDCNFNNNISVYRCHFVSVNGVSWSSDHGVYTENSHVNNGRRATIPNDWPTNSVYSAGACVYITKGSSGLGNGNEPWVFSKNSYQTTDLAYLVNANTFTRAIISYDDNFEDVPTAVASTGRKFVLVNPTYTSGDAYGFTNNFVITNTTDFTKWNVNPDTNTTTKVIDYRSERFYGAGLTVDKTLKAPEVIVDGPITARSNNAYLFLNDQRLGSSTTGIELCLTNNEIRFQDHANHNYLLFCIDGEGGHTRLYSYISVGPPELGWTTNRYVLNGTNNDLAGTLIMNGNFGVTTNLPLAGLTNTVTGGYKTNLLQFSSGILTNVVNNY